MVVLSGYKFTLFEYYFLKCDTVKMILISFNCFSEYISPYEKLDYNHAKVDQTQFK